ncbi:MAG: glycosyltransferase [Planctomycetes bacterium]|nr:glycosyltransferase [Planctomycetota bacterium]
MRTDIRNILWVRTDSIGDAVLSSSMLPYIRQKYEDAGISVVCQEHIAELYEACPYVDDIVVFDRQRALLDERYREEVVERLRALKPDVSLNSVYSREALTDWFAIKCGAEQRVALEGNLCNIPAELRNMHNQFYTNLLPSCGEHEPELKRHKDFLIGLGIEVQDLRPMVWTTQENEEFADRLFRENGLNPSKTIVLFAGAQYGGRVYERYGEALSEFCKANQLEVIALGTEQDRDINQRNLDAAGVRTVNLSAGTSIRESAAVLKRCRLAIGAETALAHITCAVGRPNVILLGGGHFGRFMPYSPLTSVVCLPLECYGCNWGCRYEAPHCVKDVAPEVIAEALRQTLEKSSPKTRLFVQGSSLWKPQSSRPAWQSCDKFLDVSAVEIIAVEGRRTAISGRENSPDIYVQGPERLQDATCRSDVETGRDARLTIATSIAPRRIEAQIEAIESWIKLGFDVVSINCAEEIESLREFFPEVRFVRPQRDAREAFGKPLIYFDEFLEYFRESGYRICGIVNSDIHLVADEGIISFIKSEAENCLIYGSRTDVDSLDHPEGEVYQDGFDFFFFDRSLISCYPESEFCIGMPWWDYWAPLIPAVEGFQTKRLVSPFAYHIRHTCEWEKEKWLFLAKRFFGYLRRRFDRDLVSNPESLWASLGRTFATHHHRYLRERGIEDTSQMSVGIIFPSALEFLEKQSQQITYKNREPAIPQHSFETSGSSEDVSIHEADSMVRSGHGQEAECDVSIVLCTKDRAGLLDQMLGSLREAAGGVAYEIIVVEGGSSDNTLDVLGKHNVREIYSESQWLGVGRHSWPQLYNFGFSKARGKWAMYASDDIVFSPGALARAVELLEKQRDEAAGGIFFYKNIHPTREDWAKYGIDFTHGNKLLMNYGLLRLESFRQVGGFDEAYRFYCADTDFCYKLYENGRQFIPLPGCFVTHNNLLDVQKQANADASGRDIELCRRRWSHFVGAEIPRPGRLLWQDDFSEAFNVPADLERIDSSIESFWHGLACFQRGLFAEAEQELMQAVRSFCDHEQVLWYLARAAYKCRDGALAEKAATAVVRLAPDFEPGPDLLIRAARREQCSPAPVLCSTKNGSISTVNGYSIRPGLEEPYDEGPVYSDAWGGLNARNQATTETTVRRTSTKSHCERSETQLRRKIEKFNKVVVWGLKTQEHTHAYIHHHFFRTLEKLGASVVLVDDRRENEDIVESNDLVISVDVSSSHLPIRDNVYYCLHNCSDDIHRRIDPSRNIRLQTYMNSAAQAGQMWDQVTFFDGKNRILFQPWATDLLADEFEEPILEPVGNIVFWVGSIWNDRLDRGNVNEIEMLKDVLEKRNIRFIHLQGISGSLNIKYVRHSLIAPTIAGRWQVENNYLPCRMWKNISYGQLGVSNVRKFDDIFNDCTVKGQSIEELIDNTLSLPLSRYRDMIYEQQEIVKSHHTYVNRLLNIIRAFEAVENY